MVMTAAKGTGKVRTTKTNYMSDDAFADLKEAIQDTAAFERGERRDLKVTRIRARCPTNAMTSKDSARLDKHQLLTGSGCDDAEHQS